MYYYGFVKNKFPDTSFTFAKGFVAKLKNVDPPVELYESYIKVASSQSENVDDTFQDRPDGGMGSLWGELGRCYELINWASGGLYWENDLKEQKEKGFFNGPSEFTINFWKQIDYYNLESVYDLTFKGVKWFDVYHADNQGLSDCWGLAFFTYQKKLRDVNYKPMKCNIPTSIEYPSLYYNRLMVEYAREA